MGVYKRSCMSMIFLVSLNILLLLNQPHIASCGSILFYMPMVTKSIRITFMPVASEMARRGHEVVIVTQHPDKNPNPNLTEIIIDGKDFNEFTDRLSAEKLKTGGNPDPPIMEAIELQLLVSSVKMYAKSSSLLLLNKMSISFKFKRNLNSPSSGSRQGSWPSGCQGTFEGGETI